MENLQKKPIPVKKTNKILSLILGVILIQTSWGKPPARTRAEREGRGRSQSREAERTEARKKVERRRQGEKKDGAISESPIDAGSRVIIGAGISVRALSELEGGLSGRERQNLQGALEIAARHPRSVGASLVREYVSVQGRDPQKTLPVTATDVFNLLAENNVAGQTQLLQVILRAEHSMDVDSVTASDAFRQAFESLSVVTQVSSVQLIRKNDHVYCPDGRIGEVDAVFTSGEVRVRLQNRNADQTEETIYREFPSTSLSLEVASLASIRPGDQVYRQKSEKEGDQVEVLKVFSNGLALVKSSGKSGEVALVGIHILRPLDPMIYGNVRAGDTVTLPDGRYGKVLSVEADGSTVVISSRVPEVNGAIPEMIVIPVSKLGYSIQSHNGSRIGDYIEMNPIAGYIHEMYTDGSNLWVKVRIEHPHMGFSHARQRLIDSEPQFQTLFFTGRGVPTRVRSQAKVREELEGSELEEPSAEEGAEGAPDEGA